MPFSIYFVIQFIPIYSIDHFYFIILLIVSKFSGAKVIPLFTFIPFHCSYGINELCFFSGYVIFQRGRTLSTRFSYIIEMMHLFKHFIFVHSFHFLFTTIKVLSDIFVFEYIRSEAILYSFYSKFNVLTVLSEVIFYSFEYIYSLRHLNCLFPLRMLELLSSW